MYRINLGRRSTEYFLKNTYCQIHFAKYSLERKNSLSIAMPAKQSQKDILIVPLYIYALGRFIKNEFWNFDNSTHFLSYKYQDKEMVQKKLCPNIAPSIGTGNPPLHPQSTLSESISMRLHKSLVQTCCLLWQH